MNATCSATGKRALTGGVGRVVGVLQDPELQRPCRPPSRPPFNPFDLDSFFVTQPQLAAFMLRF